MLGGWGGVENRQPKLKNKCTTKLKNGIKNIRHDVMLSEYPKEFVDSNEIIDKKSSFFRENIPGNYRYPVC
jgi:hypothetical protein